MISPFVNDMFAFVYLAFKNLYPNKDCEIQWVTEDLLGEGHYGCTTFGEDGKILVDISASIPVVDAVEVLAHELAHVAVGIEKDHTDEFERAFDAIFVEYNKLIETVLEASK